MKFRFGRSPAKVATRFIPSDDGAFHDSPGGLDLFNAINAQDWDTVVSLWSELPTPDRIEAVNGLDDTTAVPGLAEWAATTGRAEPAAHALLGSHGLSWAWDARGSGGSDTVTPAGWITFFDRLRMADRELHAAIRLAPDDVFPWLDLIPGGMGLQVPKAEIRLRFENQVRRDPTSLSGHRAYVQAIAGKWSGSDEQMWGFVSDVTHSVSEGSPLHSVVADGFVERVLISDETSFRDQGVSLLNQAAAKSAFHPALDNAHPIERDTCLSAFVQAFHYSAQTEERNRCLEIVSPHSTLRGTRYLGETPTERWEMAST